MVELFLCFGLFFAMVLVCVFLINVIDEIFAVVKYRYQVRIVVTGIIVQFVIIALLAGFIVFAGNALFEGR